MNKWRFVELARSDGLSVHAASWDTVNRERMGDHPLLTSVFVDRLLRYFGDNTQVLCVLDGPQSPLAMCVLQRRSAGLWTTFLPSQTQLGPLMVGDPQLLVAVVQHLPGFVLSADLLCVDPHCIALSGEQAVLHSSPHAVTMNVQLTGTFDSYWATRGAQLKKNMRRYARRSEEEGLSTRFEVLRTASEVERGVIRYAELESIGWKGAAGTALSPHNEQGRFYSDLMVTYAGLGKAYVHEMWLGNSLAASRLVIEAGTMLVILKTTYNEELERFAPGRLLLLQVLKWAFVEHADKAVEFYTDASPDQQAWATGLRPIKHWTVFRSQLAEKSVAAIRILRLLMRPPAIPEGRVSTSVALVSSMEGLPADAIKLLDTGESTSVQFGADWFRALSAAVFQNQSLTFAVVRDGDTCVAVLPTFSTKSRCTVEVRALSNYYTAIYAPALKPGVKPAVLVPAIQALAGACGGATRFTFAPMDPHGLPYRNLLTAFELAGWVPFKFFCFGNWVLQTQQSWQAYEAGLDSRLRNTVSRMHRRFHREGGTLEVVQEPAALGPALDSYLAVYAKSWKVAEPYPAFLPEIVRRFGPRKSLRLGLAWFQGKPVAAQLWFVEDGRADIYKLAHDEEFKRFSPGTLLTARMLQQAMEVDRVREVDYLSGDDPYKKDWMQIRRERWGLVAYNPRQFWGAVGLLREISGRFVRVVLGRTPG